MESDYIYSMIDLKPNQFVVRNGKIQHKDREEITQTFRVIPYPHTVRVHYDDYYNYTLLQYKKQIQQLKKNYAELQKAYWELLQSTKSSSQHTPRQHLKFQDSNLKDNSTLIESRSVYRSMTLNPLENSLKKSHDGNSLVDYRSPLKNSNLYNSYILEQKVTDEEKQVEAQDFIKRVEERTIRNLNEEDEDLREFYLRNMKQMEEILSVERGNTKVLNGAIERMRGEMESKNDILRYVTSSEHLDTNDIKRMVKSMHIKL